MKVNVPEKIYLFENPITETPDDRWLSKRSDKNDIEYVRKDAFIEKAINFLEMLGYGFTITDNITHKNYDKEQLIDDFRNYMKEE